MFVPKGRVLRAEQIMSAADAKTMTLPARKLRHRATGICGPLAEGAR